MSTSDLPPSLLARHPELVEVGEVLEALREGRPFTTVCRTCHKPLEVIEPPGTGELWIRCATGCTFFHARRKASGEKEAGVNPE